MIAKEKKSSNIGAPQLRFSGIVYWKFVPNEIAKNDKMRNTPAKALTMGNERKAND